MQPSNSPLLKFQIIIPMNKLKPYLLLPESKPQNAIGLVASP